MKKPVRRQITTGGALSFLPILLPILFAPQEALATYADDLPIEKVVGLFPKSWAANVRANWPKVKAALARAHLDDSRSMVLYALATIRVETVAFSPAPERPSRYSRKNDKVGYAGIQGIVIQRDFGAYDSSLKFTKGGKVIINKSLGNCYYRGKDEDLMRSRHGDPPLLPCDDGQRFKGRGFVQITGRYNYARMQKYLANTYSIDLINNPELAADVDHAADILAAYLSVIKPIVLNALERYDYTAARKAVNSAGLGTAEFQAVFRKAQEEGI